METRCLFFNFMKIFPSYAYDHIRFQPTTSTELPKVEIPDNRVPDSPLNEAGILRKVKLERNPLPRKSIFENSEDRFDFINEPFVNKRPFEIYEENISDEQHENIPTPTESLERIPHLQTTRSFVPTTTISNIFQPIRPVNLNEQVRKLE